MYLGYIIKITMVSQNELSLCTVLPAPVREPINNLYIYFEPGIEYLAIGYTKEYYTTYSREKLNNCKRTNDFVLCPPNQLTLVNLRK